MSLHLLAKFFIKNHLPSKRHRTHARSRKLALASLGLKLVDIVILFNFASSLSISLKPPLRPPPRMEWTTLSSNIYSCVALRYCRATSFASTLPHLPSTPNHLFRIVHYDTRSLPVSRMLHTQRLPSYNIKPRLPNSHPKRCDTPPVGQQFLRLSFSTFCSIPPISAVFLDCILMDARGSHLVSVTLRPIPFNCIIILVLPPTPFFPPFLLSRSIPRTCLTKTSVP